MKESQLLVSKTSRLLRGICSFSITLTYRKYDNSTYLKQKKQIFCHKYRIHYYPYFQIFVISEKHVDKFPKNNHHNYIACFSNLKFPPILLRQLTTFSLASMRKITFSPAREIFRSRIIRWQIYSNRFHAFLDAWGVKRVPNPATIF